MEYRLIRGSFITVASAIILFILITRDVTAVYEHNICSYIDCTFMAYVPGKIVLAAIYGMLAILYLLNIRMRIVTFLLTLISLLVFSYEESIGLKGGYALITLIFFSQFAAELFNKHRNAYKIQFPIQAITAAYVLSGISKLQASGIDWFMDNAPNFSLQLMRIFQSQYSTYGTMSYNQTAWELSQWCLEHVFIIQTLLALSLLIELCCFIALISKNTSFYYGFVLMAFHLGIFLLMDVFLPVIVLPMLIFFINPLYWLYRGGISLRKALRS